MQNKFIIDKEINLNESDFLKTKIYADNLSKIIKNSGRNKVFTVGLFGNWGTGKSSIIKTSQLDFDDKKIKFIKYDAWQYVNDSFRRMFLLRLREDLNYEETDLMKKFYENESLDIGNKYKLSSTRLVFVLSGLILLLAILTFIPFQIEYKFPVYAIFTLLGLLITIISGAFHQLKISVTKPHLFAPEQFEDCFKEIVSNSLSKTNKVLKWVKGDNSIKNLEKLVIVIDNIDRCSSDVAYNLLSDIKTFLSLEPYSIVFVIPVDDEALKNHIIKNSKTEIDCNQEKEEFLRKFFNLTFRIKPYGETDMYSFAKQISEKSGIQFKPETINVASKEYAKNPRRIIQLFNNLLAEMNYYNSDFIQKNETLICCILIIREEYPKFYDIIINSPKKFNQDNSEAEENVKRFIRIAHTALGKVPISDLSKILTNTYHQFDDIASDIKDAIETYNTEKVLSVWESEKEHIIDVIIDKLYNAIKNKLIETDLIAFFDLCAQINSKYTLESHFTKRIDEKLLPYFSEVVLKTKNHENLCKYALLREKQNDNYIKGELIKHCKRSENQEKDSHWNSLFNAALKVFKDKETSFELSSTYTIYCDSVDSEDFSDEQIENLISDQIVQKRIADLPSSENNEEILLNTDSKEYLKVKWIFKNKKNIANETYGHFFAKIIGVNNDESRMRGKSIEEIAKIVDFINPLLNLIPDNKLTTEPQALYNLIVNDRKIPHPSYPMQKQHDSSKNFIDQCIESEVYISEIIEFVINIYRISNNNTNVQNEIDKLLKYTFLNEEFIQLIDNGYSLHSPILNSIFDDEDDFSDNSRLKILKYCFNQKDNEGKYIIEEEVARIKLNELLNYAQTNKSNEAFILLEELILYEQYKNILTNLIVQKDSIFITSLPSKFLKLAVNSFNKDNYNDYANNFEFLSVIMNNGSNTQKGYVVKILTAKLDNNQDVEIILNLINSIENIPSFDKSGLLFSHLDNYQRQNKENISEDVNVTIDQLKKKAK
jgi:hypothetical protein